MATQGNVRVPFFSLRSRRLYVMSTRGAREISVARPGLSHLLLSSASYACCLFLTSFLGYSNLILRFQDSYSRKADF